MTNIKMSSEQRVSQQEASGTSDLKVKNMKKIILSCVVLLAGLVSVTFANGDDDNNGIVVQKVSQAPDSKEMAGKLKMDYKVTAGKLPRTIRKAAANGLTANFSVQGGSSQVSVWSENFDTDLSQWTINNQVRDDFGPVTIELASTASKAHPYKDIDASDVTSLHFDGDYRVSKRNTAYVTSSDIEIPANARFHAWVGYYEWETCALYISVSTDDFETSTELWNSKNTGASWEWRQVDADLGAFAGKTIKVRITYGEGTKQNFGVGGYSGDFYVDGLSITGVSTVDQINVMTGEEISFVDLSAGNPTAWQWSFPGGTPATSTEQNPTVYYEQPGTYDVTLTVTDAEGSDVVTKTAFVNVEGQAPVAGVEWPADFRDFTTRMRMVAPLTPILYKDASEGFPTSYTWTFLSEYDNTGGIVMPTVYTDKDQEYTHEKLNKWYVTHIAVNDGGYDFVDDSVQAQFAGLVSNFQPKDTYTTNFTDGDLTFPGANKMGITAWAEKISKPSVPVVMSAMYVIFTKASAEELTDQISSVGFYLYTSEDGKPGQPIELLDSWTMSELNYAMTTNSGVVTLELSKEYIINDEVFIVIDGIPEKNDNLECAIGMAPMRDNGNTAFMLKNGQWRPFTGYFQASPGGQTSLAVFPYFTHSVIVPAEVDSEGKVTVGEDVVNVGKEAGTVEKAVFAYRGVEYVGSDASWCRLTGTPGDETVDYLTIEYDALPSGIDSREANVTVTDADGVSTLVIHVIQSATTTSVNAVSATIGNSIEVYDLQGRKVADRTLRKGVYIYNGKKIVK